MNNRHIARIDNRLKIRQKINRNHVSLIPTMSTYVSLDGSQTILDLNWFYNSPVVDRINMQQPDDGNNYSARNVVGRTPDMPLQHGSFSSSVKDEEHILELKQFPLEQQEDRTSNTLTVEIQKEHVDVYQETETIPKTYYTEQHSSEDIAEAAWEQCVHDDTQGNPDKRASGSQEQHLSGEERILELKEFQPEQQEDRNLKSECFETIQKRTRLVKAYAWIKEEMVRATANSVADHLYQHQPILLSFQDLESIQAAKQRRDAVELLLKKVLMGPDDIHDVFVDALRKEGGEEISEQLCSGQITEEDTETFVKLEKSAEHCTLRPDSDKPRMTFTDTQIDILSYWIKDRSVIDSVNDHLLSRLIFRINEHTDIADSSMDSKQKLQRLIKTMKLCSENIFKDFREILDLDTVCMPHVFTKLNTKNIDAVVSRQKEKRKSSSSMEDITESTPLKQQRMQNCLSESNESRIVRTVQQPGSNVRNKAHELGLEVIRTEKGSIIIQLAPKDSDSWLILKSRCRDGKIKDFIPEIFRNNQEDLKEGEYRFKFTIYVLPIPPYSSADKRLMFHLEAMQTISIDIEEHAKLLCQELEITDDLLSKLQKENVVDENIKRDIANNRTRRSKIQYLLNKIASHGERGYSILKEHIRTTNEYLYGMLDVRDDTKKINSTLSEAANITPRPASASREIKKEVFYSAELVLLVTKTEVEEKGDKKRSEVEITCPTIVNFKCFFNEEELQEELGGKRKARASSDSGDVFTAREFPDKKVYDKTNKDVSKELKIPVTGTVHEMYHCDSYEKYHSLAENRVFSAGQLRLGELQEDLGGKRIASASSDSVDVCKEENVTTLEKLKTTVKGEKTGKEDDVTTLEKLKTTVKGEKTGKQNKEMVSN